MVNRDNVIFGPGLEVINLSLELCFGAGTAGQRPKAATPLSKWRSPDWLAHSAVLSVG